MSRKLQAVIFDMDGVIVDTDELYHIVNKAIADKLKIPFTYEDSERLKGIRRMDIIEDMVKRSGQDLTEKEKQDLAVMKNKHYLRLIENMDQTSVFPGIVKFLDELKENQIKLGLASSSTNGKTVLQKVGLIDYFDTIVDPYALKKGKPDPEIFLTAADILGVPYENCAALEDGEAGMKGIKATPMFSIGVGHGAAIVRRADWHVTSTAELNFTELLQRFGK